MCKKKPSLFLLIFILIVPIFMSTSIDNDTWWLINTGKYIFENGIPTIEPFTIHENLTFYAQQWLFDIIIYPIYNLFGLIGVSVFVKILSILIIFLLYKFCMFITDNNVSISLVITLISTCVFNMFFMVARPQLFSLSIFLIELFILEKFIKTNNKKLLLLIPLLSLVLINMHASMWLMLLVLMLPYLVESFSTIIIKKEELREKFSLNPKTRLPLLFTFIASTIAGFINPYGIKMMTYLFRSYGIDEINSIVSEMRPPSFDTPVGIIGYILIFATIIAICLNRTNKLNIRYFFLIKGTTELTLSSMRGVAILCVATFFIVAYRYKDSFQKFKIPEVFDNLNQKFIIAVSAFLVIIVAFNCYSTIKNQQNPVGEAAHYIEKNYEADDAIIYTGYDDGGYLQFLGYKTYIDPRAEVFLKSNNGVYDYFVEYYGLLLGRYNIKSFIDKYNFTHIIVNPEQDQYLNAYLKNTDLNQDFVCEYTDDNRTVWVREDISVKN